jgi:uncharacterized membrane protein
MILFGALVVLAVILAVGWFAMQTMRVRRREQADDQAIEKMREMFAHDEIDDEFAHQVAVDQQARDKGAV